MTDKGSKDIEINFGDHRMVDSESIEPKGICVEYNGKTYYGEYVLDDADDGYTYVIAYLDGYGQATAVLGSIGEEMVAKNLLLGIARKGEQALK